MSKKKKNALKEIQKKVKKQGFVGEFKEFIMRGNVVDLAVGVIIGAAFQTIINSLVGDIIMPLIGVVTGGVDFSNKFISLTSISDGTDVSTLEAAKQAGPVFAYGAFVTAVLNFLIMAAAIFLLVKILNGIRNLGAKKQAESNEPTDKECPFCKTSINLEATRCPNCTSQLEDEQE